MGSVVWKVLATVAGIAATKVASKATTSGWQAATGNPAPVGKHDPNYSAKQIAVFTLVSAAIAQGLRALAERKAADFYTKSAGHPPQVVAKQREKAVAKAVKA